MFALFKDKIYFCVYKQTTHMGRGGARAGAGRKPRPDRQRNKALGVRCSRETADRLRRLAAHLGAPLGEAVEVLLDYYEGHLKK